MGICNDFAKRDRTSRTAGRAPRGGGGCGRLSRGWAAACGAALACAAGFPAALAVCINEVLYDPAGRDRDGEFVELYNPAAVAVSLAGWRVEAGNGARAGDWRRQWEGTAGDRIAPGGYFVIAGRAVAGAVDARAALTMQNGPDAVRVCGPEGEIDLVGWGAHQFPEYAEGRPAEDVPSGMLLARVPDGVDSGDNARDFQRRARATVGAPNALRHALALRRWLPGPPVWDGCQPPRIEVALVNDGTEALALATAEVTIRVAERPAVTVGLPPHLLAPGGECEAAWELVHPGALGLVPVRLEVRHPAIHTLAVTETVRTGAGLVRLSELLYAPGSGEGEWIELFNRGDRPVDLAGWCLRDASGREAVLSAPATIPAEGCLLVAAEPIAFQRVHAIASTAFAAWEGSWPTLNNTTDAQLGFADEICLIGGDGIAVDYARYATGSLDGDGVSLERWFGAGAAIDPCAWLPCPAASGSTPARARAGDEGVSWVPGADERPLVLYPDRTDAPGGCRVLVPAPVGAVHDVTAEVYALCGRRVATLVAAARCRGPLVLEWAARGDDGRRVPSGCYLLRILRRDRAARCERRTVRPLAVVRG